MTGERPDQIPGRLNGKPAMIDIGRVGVSLLDEGVRPDIIELPDEYDLRDRQRSAFDYESYVPGADELARSARRPAGYIQRLG